MTRPQHCSQNASQNIHLPVRSPQQIPPCTRRFSVAFFASLPIIDSITNEARLWNQELDLYSRRAAQSASSVFDWSSSKPHRTASSTITSSKTIPLDAEFAASLLSSIITPAGPAARSVKEDADVIAARELPAFQRAGSCGHCGTIKGPKAFKDKDWFDFEAYVLSKAMVQRCNSSSNSNNKSTTQIYERCISDLRLAIGECILGRILSEIDVTEAAAVGISPLRSTSSGLALLGASPKLESVRGGTIALLDYFKRKGCIQEYTITHFGISNDEYENEMTWERGEPSFLQYTLVQPVDIRSTAALQSEENGALLGFVASAVAAYMKRCGVEVESFSRLPSFDENLQVTTEQVTLRRFKPLP